MAVQPTNFVDRVAAALGHERPEHPEPRIGDRIVAGVARRMGPEWRDTVDQLAVNGVIPPRDGDAVDGVRTFARDSHDAPVRGRRLLRSAPEETPTGPMTIASRNPIYESPMWKHLAAQHPEPLPEAPTSAPAEPSAPRRASSVGPVSEAATTRGGSLLSGRLEDVGARVAPMVEDVAPRVARAATHYVDDSLRLLRGLR